MANQYLMTMKIVDPQKRLEILDQQRKFVENLRANGTIERAWRFTGTAGAIAILNASSKEGAERIYADSPFARNGVVEFEIQEIALVE